MVPRSDPSCTTAVTIRHGVPVSDALRNDRPSHVPAYFWAGPAAPEVRDLSPGAHAATSTAAQSSVRISCLRYVSRMEYERSDGPTQGSGVEPRDVRLAGAPASRRPRRTRGTLRAP